MTISVIVSLLVVLLLAACEAAPPVIPTAAQLPTVTTAPPTVAAPTVAAPTVVPPSPVTEASQTPEEELFFTATPDDADAEEPGFSTPTPIVLAETPQMLMAPVRAVPTGPCTSAALADALAGTDQEALIAAHSAFVADLRAAAAELAGWTLSAEPDPFEGTVVEDALPLAQLRYEREAGERLSLLVSTIPVELQETYYTCLRVQDFFRQGGTSPDAEVFIEMIRMGDRTSRATVTEPLPQGNESGLAALVTVTVAVLVDDALIQYVNIPMLDEVMGQDPVPMPDVEALLAALVEVVRGL